MGSFQTVHNPVYQYAALAKYDEALKYAPNWKALKEARETLTKQKT
jgi:hypothetical protein